MNTDTARMYDPDTGNIVTIPARELAEGMVRAKIDGIEGEVWVDSHDPRWLEGPLRQPPFPEEIRAIFGNLQRTFREVYPISVEQWEDGFRRDEHPEREITIWLRMAGVFRHFTGGRKMSLHKKEGIFQTLLACSSNGPNGILLTAPPMLDRKLVRKIARRYFGNR